MPLPEIPHPVPLIAYRAFRLHFRRDVTLSLPQKPRPDSLDPKHIFKLGPFSRGDPEPAVDDEPLRSESLRCSLHLRDDFLRDGSRSLLIAGKVHRVFRAALG
jgi:hypothetical protein